MGTPQFALPSLEAILAAGEEVAAVVTQPDRPRGRGQVVTASPVKELALAWNLPVLQPQRLKDPELIRDLEALPPEIMIVVAYGRILPPEILALPSVGVPQCPCLAAAPLPGGGPHQLGPDQGRKGDRGDHPVAPVRTGLGTDFPPGAGAHRRGRQLRDPVRPAGGAGRGPAGPIPGHAAAGRSRQSCRKTSPRLPWPRLSPGRCAGSIGNFRPRKWRAGSGAWTPARGLHPMAGPGAQVIRGPAEKK